MLKKYYRVADHFFSVELDDHSALWSKMSAYAPFECEVDDQSELIFSISSRADNSIEPIEFIGQFDNEMVDITACHTANNGLKLDFATPRTDDKTTIFIDTNGFATISFCRDSKYHYFGFNNAMMVLFAMRTMLLDTLLLHASVVAVGGWAYLFQGRSGMGKSTHSRMWIEAIDGAELLNDDNPAVRVVGETVTIYGTPWSGKTQCYRNLALPLGAIVRIVQGPENRIERLATLKSFASLLPSCSTILWDKELDRALHKTVERVILGVGCYQLECLANGAAAELCYKTVVRR